MSGRGPHLVVLYRWRLQPGAESDFVDAWSRVTSALRERGGSLGSRLHRGSDGLWYAYAQWPDEATRQQAFAGALEPEATARMRAVAQSFPEVLLETAADFLVLPPAAGA